MQHEFEMGDELVSKWTFYNFYKSKVWLNEREITLKMEETRKNVDK